MSFISNMTTEKIEHTKGVIRQTDNTIEKRLNIPKE